MVGITSPGIGSGLDIKSIVQSLVNAEIDPMKIRRDKKSAGVQTELSAVGQLKSSLSSLKSALGNLGDLSKLYTLKSSLSDSDHFSASLSTSAVKGTYAVEVLALAKSNSLVSGNFAPGATTNLGTGDITIELGSYASGSFVPASDTSAKTVTISASNNSLEGIKNAINNSGASVTASITSDDSGSKLTIKSNKTGVGYELKITTTGATGSVSDFAYDKLAASPMTLTQAGQDSQVKVNATTLTQSTNTLTTAITGVTLNLTKDEVGKTTTLTVDDNKDFVSSQVKDFVGKYNDTINLLYKLSGYDLEAKQGGVFQGDAQFIGIRQGLTSLIGNLYGKTGNIHALADLGIKTDPKNKGNLTIDESKLSSALSANYKDIGNLFAKTATLPDQNIRVNAVGTKVTEGTYTLNITNSSPLAGQINTAISTLDTNGYTLKGSGQFLGLNLDVLDTTVRSTTLTVEDGLAVKLSTLLDSYTQEKGGLTLRTNQLNNQVKDLDKEQARIDRREQLLQKQFSKQYTALDGLLGRMQAQMSSLTQQLASISANTNKG